MVARLEGVRPKGRNQGWFRTIPPSPPGSRYIDDIIEVVVRVVDKLPDGDEQWNGDKPNPATSLRRFVDWYKQYYI